MIVADSVNSKANEDDCLRTAAQHFHCVFDRRVRFFRNITLYVILHCNSTERDPKLDIIKKNNQANENKVDFVYEIETHARMPDMWKISAFK